MSTTYQIIGKLRVKMDEQQISDRFKKREFVIEVENERNSDWNDFIKFQLTQDRCNDIEDYSLGSQIKVSFNVRGRKFEKDGRVNYFSNLEAWKVEKDNSDQPAQEETTEEEVIPGMNTDLPSGDIEANTDFDSESDDLPF